MEKRRKKVSLSAGEREASRLHEATKAVTGLSVSYKLLLLLLPTAPGPDILLRLSPSSGERPNKSGIS